jgi:biopolymer transport protein TolR
MTMNSGKSGGMTSEINVTPMIDVLLVLLIIFMVIVPALPRGEAALVPKASSGKTTESVVLEVLKAGNGDLNFRINQQVVARQDLPAKLAAIYANRARRVLFVKGDDTLSFTQVAQVIDIGHMAGVDQIGLITPKGMAGK